MNTIALHWRHLCQRFSGVSRLGRNGIELRTRFSQLMRADLLRRADRPGGGGLSSLRTPPRNGEGDRDARRRGGGVPRLKRRRGGPPPPCFAWVAALDCPDSPRSCPGGTISPQHPPRSGEELRM